MRGEGRRHGVKDAAGCLRMSVAMPSPLRYMNPTVFDVPLFLSLYPSHPDSKCVIGRSSVGWYPTNLNLILDTSPRRWTSMSPKFGPVKGFFELASSLPADGRFAQSRIQQMARKEQSTLPRRDAGLL